MKRNKNLFLDTHSAENTSKITPADMNLLLRKIMQTIKLSGLNSVVVQCETDNVYRLDIRQYGEYHMILFQIKPK